MNQVVSAPAIGIHRNVSFDDYAAWDAVNSHLLNGFSRTPAHVLYDLQHGGKDRTAALDLGWLVHLAILEPDRFKSEIVVPPKVDRRTKVGKETWAQFQAANPGAQFVDADTMAKAKAMRDAVLAHPTAGPFFSGKGYNEISLLWEDEASGLLCKARIDRVGLIGEWPIVGDLKTARDASRRAFERSVNSYGYHVQAVHYLEGLQAIQPTPDGSPFRRLVFFVVESDPPHCVALYELDDLALDEGAGTRSRYMRTWKECVQTGQWPGYASGIDYASLPAWALRSYIQD